jgi:hypothetical protein
VSQIVYDNPAAELSCSIENQVPSSSHVVETLLSLSLSESGPFIFRTTRRFLIVLLKSAHVRLFSATKASFYLLPPNRTFVAFPAVLQHLSQFQEITHITRERGPETFSFCLWPDSEGLGRHI